MLENNHENIISGTYLGQKECILLRRYSWSMGTVWTGMGCQGRRGSHTWGPAGGNSPEYAQRIDCSTGCRIKANVEYNIFADNHPNFRLSQLVKTCSKHHQACVDLRGCTGPTWAPCPRPCSWPPASCGGSRAPASRGTGHGATADIWYIKWVYEY